MCQHRPTIRLEGKSKALVQALGIQPELCQRHLNKATKRVQSPWNDERPWDKLGRMGIESGQVVVRGACNTQEKGPARILERQKSLSPAARRLHGGVLSSFPAH